MRPDAFVWIVLLGFYLLDNVKFVDSCTIFVQGGRRNRWHPIFNAVPFTLNKREICITNPLMPMFPLIKMMWFARDGDPQRLVGRATRRATIIRARAYSYSVLSLFAIVLFFFIGPLLTMLRGLSYALTAIAPLYVALLAAIYLMLVTDRHRLRWSWSQLAATMLELAVCPGYIANLTRRISTALPCPRADGLAFCLSNPPTDSDPRAREQLIARIDLRLEDLAAENGEDHALLADIYLSGNPT